MPEEQAFTVLVSIMFEYGLRDLFKNNFEVLHLYFYQLDKLIEASVVLSMFVSTTPSHPSVIAYLLILLPACLCL
jgi:hypothetical protein